MLAETPGHPSLLSVRAQVEYLHRYAMGEDSEERLQDVNLGLIAAREIEGWNNALADLLHIISAQIRS